MNAVLLISHGSRSPKTKEEVQALVAKLRKDAKYDILEYAFLEMESPSIPEGIETCVQSGAKKVILLLNFLNAGKHVDEDIPGIVNEFRAKYPQIEFQITRPIGQHPDIAELFHNLLSDET